MSTKETTYGEKLAQLAEVADKIAWELRLASKGSLNSFLEASSLSESLYNKTTELGELFLQAVADREGKEAKAQGKPQ